MSISQSDHGGTKHYRECPIFPFLLFVDTLWHQPCEHVLCGKAYLEVSFDTSCLFSWRCPYAFGNHHANVLVFYFQHSLKPFQINIRHSFAYRTKWLVVIGWFNMLLAVLCVCMLFGINVVAHLAFVFACIFMFYIISSWTLGTLAHYTDEVMKLSFSIIVITFDFVLSHPRRDAAFLHWHHLQLAATFSFKVRISYKVVMSNHTHLWTLLKTSSLHLHIMLLACSSGHKWYCLSLRSLLSSSVAYFH